MTAVPALHRPVRDEWIDANGHLSEAYYVLVFGEATEHALAHLGMTPAYRTETGCMVFTVEAHLRYLDQVLPGERLEVRTQVIGVDAKRLLLWHEMSAGGRLRATAEVLGVHVYIPGGRSRPFTDDVRAAAEALLRPVPPDAGRTGRR
ncbi:thioesterase [Spongiactinospora rosea]|uniref:Thioesterase n=1 Tax=Spongiactinospora rosea TaxID=2248750 RepID=A0A366LM19_9ACTN|nr:thioesterase family protein [Spongiactinospora rosea]RBQ14931.1 thioesterase [Spongiactinospora rosea]